MSDFAPLWAKANLAIWGSGAGVLENIYVPILTHEQYIKRRGFMQGSALRGSQSNNLLFNPLYSPQNRHIWACFRRDFKILARKRL